MFNLGFLNISNLYVVENLNDFSLSLSLSLGLRIQMQKYKCGRGSKVESLSGPSYKFPLLANLHKHSPAAC